MQLRSSGSAYSVQIVGDGTTNTLTMQISDICLFGNVADISPVDAVKAPSGGINTPTGLITGTVALNPKGTAVTAVFASAPTGDCFFNLEFLRNV